MIALSLTVVFLFLWNCSLNYRLTKVITTVELIANFVIIHEQNFVVVKEAFSDVVSVNTNLVSLVGAAYEPDEEDDTPTEGEGTDVN